MARNPELFKAIDKEINDAYGELRKHVTKKYGVKLPASIDVYVFDYIYRIIETCLPDRDKSDKFGAKLTHDSIKIKPIVIKLVAYVVKSNKITVQAILKEMRNHKRFEQNTNQIIVDVGNRGDNAALIDKIDRDRIGM